ncbi:hypothetical protein, partial [Oceanisphaera arctica]|uniref:hypothetical protein n=1 Tax=Oceanisphaera arctica TaxID=641510 RepID=UPI001CA47D07
CCTILAYFAGYVSWSAVTPPPSLPLAISRRYACYPAAKGEEQFGASSNNPALFADISPLRRACQLKRQLQVTLPL